MDSGSSGGDCAEGEGDALHQVLVDDRVQCKVEEFQKPSHKSQGTACTLITQFTRSIAKPQTGTQKFIKDERSTLDSMDRGDDREQCVGCPSTGDRVIVGEGHTCQC